MATTGETKTKTKTEARAWLDNFVLQVQAGAPIWSKYDELSERIASRLAARPRALNVNIVFWYAGHDGKHVRVDLFYDAYKLLKPYCREAEAARKLTSTWHFIDDYRQFAGAGQGRTHMKIVRFDKSDEKLFVTLLAKALRKKER